MDHAPTHAHHDPERSDDPAPYRGHAHFWERALSRRQLVRGALGGTTLAASGLLLPGAAAAAPIPPTADPRPIAPATMIGGEAFRVRAPQFGSEVSTITDFNGMVAAAEMQGTGTATDTRTFKSSPVIFDADMRVMQGTYIGLDGNPHVGAFGFV
ncbi:MAG TPA: hypothetical protein VFI42_01025 [Thermomicrobiaceae bacterium]|nr:hypothetical protein [Thermomicrobiaceae bacterium]